MSGRSTPRSASSPHPVIPPIITNEKDRCFLINLNKYIEHELEKVDPTNPEQRYTVYKGSFDKVIDHVTAYKPLLTAIKAEYEDCIDTIQRGQREAFYLAGKLKAMASEPSTIRNYKKRSEELDKKLSIIQSDNGRLEKQLEQLRSARQQHQLETIQAEEKTTPCKVFKKDRRNIPGLTLQQATDMKTLSKEAEKVERQLRELCLSQRSRYSPKDHKIQLKEQLSHKVNTRDVLAEQCDLLKARRQKLKVALEAAEAYVKLQPPHQTIGGAVLNALVRAGKLAAPEKDDGLLQETPSTSFDEDDPSKEKEAELMLEYIEKFNELLDARKYEEAAIHAANSPKGILRTSETLHRFKELAAQVSSGRSPLLAFCDALMSTVLAFGVRPSEYMSLECVTCALKENRLDLLSHWISQDRLTMTNKLGNLIYDHCQEKTAATRTCLSLAQKVYMGLDAYVPAVICMVRQGRIKQAIEYARKVGLHHDDYLHVLKTCPGPQLSHALYQNMLSGRSLLPLGVIVRTLLASNNEDIGLHLLHDIQQHTPKEPGSQNSGALRQGIFSDDQTSADEWLDIVQKCQEYGYDEAGLEILAAVTVMTAMKLATQNARSIEDVSQEGDQDEDEDELLGIQNIDDDSQDDDDSDER